VNKYMVGCTVDQLAADNRVHTIRVRRFLMWYYIVVTFHDGTVRILAR
jgi:hypothetical protein